MDVIIRIAAGILLVLALLAAGCSVLLSGATSDASDRSRGMTDRDTMTHMGTAISVRLDDDAARALRRLEASGLSRSEAIRSSLVAAGDRLHRRGLLAAEVAALEADVEDRREMLAVADLMESLRAPG